MHCSPVCSSRPTSPTPVAKIAGIKLCESYRRQYGDDFISVMPTNLYGPGDTFDPAGRPRGAIADASLPRGQGRPASTRWSVWGTGLASTGVPPRRRPRGRLRLPDGLVLGSETHVNVGHRGRRHDPRAGRDRSATSYIPNRRIAWDSDKPDGTPRKLLDVSKLAAPRMEGLASSSTRGSVPPTTGCSVATFDGSVRGWPEWSQPRLTRHGSRVTNDTFRPAVALRRARPDDERSEHRMSAPRGGDRR